MEYDLIFPNANGQATLVVRANGKLVLRLEMDREGLKQLAPKMEWAAKRA